MSSKYAAYSSDFISYTIDKERGRVAFFGIESGGRDRDKHASYNLMLPGYGAQVGAFKKGKLSVAEADETSAFFENGKTAVHTMTGFSKRVYRDIKVFGTKAELYGHMEDMVILLFR